MSPSPSLVRDLARLLALLAGRRLDCLTDRERLSLARVEARLILKRHALGVYRGEATRRPEPSEN